MANSIGGYLLGQHIGRGATGDVYRATRGTSGQIFAVKVLRGDIANDHEIVGRFLQERSLLVRFDDPSLVRVHDLVVEGGSAAIVMDFIDGGDLRQYLNSSRQLSIRDSVEKMATVFQALDIVHAAGVLHRDIKPENILLDSSGSPHLSDFGIARLVDRPRMTQAITILGTPTYMAPELGAGADSSTASDVYAASIVLFELLTGSAPFTGANPLALMRQHSEAEPNYPEDIPSELRTLFSRTLAKNPLDRISAKGARDELLAILSLPNIDRELLAAPRPRASTEETVMARVTSGDTPGPYTDFTIMTPYDASVTSPLVEEEPIESVAYETEPTHGFEPPLGIDVKESPKPNRRVLLFSSAAVLLALALIAATLLIFNGGSSSNAAAAVSNVRVTTSNQAAMLRWSSVSSKQNIAKFVVTSIPGDKSCTTKSSDCVVSGLRNGTKYRFKIESLGTNGTKASAYSNSVTPFTVPGVVLGLHAKLMNATSALISWSPKSPDGGSAFTGFVVNFKPSATCQRRGFTCRALRLRTNTKYRFCIRAKNQAGTGMTGSCRTFTTPAKRPTRTTHRAVIATTRTTKAPHKGVTKKHPVTVTSTTLPGSPTSRVSVVANGSFLMVELYNFANQVVVYTCHYPDGSQGAPTNASVYQDPMEFSTSCEYEIGDWVSVVAASGKTYTSNVT